MTQLDICNYLNPDGGITCNLSNDCDVFVHRYLTSETQAPAVLYKVTDHMAIKISSGGATLADKPESPASAISRYS